MKYQDIQISDNALLSQFVQYWLNGNYSSAFAIIGNNPQLDSKAFLATAINLIGQAIVTVESYYSTNVTDYFVLKLTEFNTAVDNFRQKTTWDSSTNYLVGNFVDYNSDIYLCVMNNTNILPTNTTYWVYLGLRGDTVNSLNMTLKYNWNSSSLYNKNDVVTYNNIMYYALQSNQNQNPSTATAYWGVLLNIPKAKIIVSQAQPIDLYDGLIWWQIL